MGERNAGPSTTVAAATSAQDDRLNNMSTTTPMSTIATAEVSAARFAAQPLLVRRAAVLGAGTMGSRIAAHLANAGIPVLLLDMVPEGEGARNRLAQAALAALAKTKPAAFFEPSLAALITPGNFEDDLPKTGAMRLGDRGRCGESRDQDRAAGARCCRILRRAQF